MSDVRSRIAPILERVVNKLLKTKPDDPIGHMIHFLEQEKGSHTDTLSKEERAELKELRKKYKHLRQRKLEEEKQEQSSQSEDDDEDYVDDLPKAQATRTSGKARTSVSSEAYGRYHIKEDYKPVVIPKSDAEKEKIRATLLESFMFSNLEEQELAIVLDAIKVVEVAEGSVVI
jgi:hypothetical protein